MTNGNISKESVGESETMQNRDQSASRLSLSSQSERKVGGDSSRRESRRLSRISETITVISDCGKAPDTCVLCGNGIPFSRCLECHNEAHNRCIEAFFCTTGKKVILSHWKCPKCVTLSNIKNENKDKREERDIKGKEESKSNQVDLLIDIPVVEETGCPFCKMDMEKNCMCRECVGCLDKSSKMQQTQRYSNDQGDKAQMLKYNKCLQYRDFNAKIDYEYLEDEDTFEDGDVAKDSVAGKGCWCIAWFLLFITFAFPIALISSFIFIFIYCFDACCSSCHPVCCFFLEGIKLPGTCCRGMCSGEPMCSYKDEIKDSK